MDGFWEGLWKATKDFFLVAFGVAFGISHERDAQEIAAAKQTIKELKTDAKNREDVADLSDGELDDELRNPPPRR